MDWAALISTIAKGVSNTGQLVGGIASYDAQRKGADQMERDAAERQRRMAIEEAQFMGKARAGAAASGLSMDSGSISNYLDAMQAELDRQAEWTREADEAKVGAARTSADWQLGGSIFSWLTGSGSEMSQSFASGFGQSESQAEKSSASVNSGYDMSNFGELDGAGEGKNKS